MADCEKTDRCPFTDMQKGQIEIRHCTGDECTCLKDLANRALYKADQLPHLLKPKPDDAILAYTQRWHEPLAHIRDEYV